MQQDDTAAITQVLTDYYKAFSTLDPHAISVYFREPSLMIGPPGVAAAATHTDVERAFSTLMEGLRARGYGRSELIVPRITRLSAIAACASGIAVRYKADGRELERAGVTYLLTKVGSDWKLTVLVVHDPDHVLGAE